MRLTSGLFRQLNWHAWNRKVYEVGYRGPLLSKKKATGKPDYPVSQARLARLRTALEREYQVMRCLATPYVTREQEDPYLTKFGTPEEQLAKKVAEKQQQQMPNKPKVVTDRTSYDKWRGNIGNLLHSHRTVEDSMKHLIRRTRYD
uniref:Uncharacterized protein n=1 Tax=Plectus sambesii TaxID=2011161 RepID=A0A914WH13_9BILA